MTVRKRSFTIRLLLFASSLAINFCNISECTMFRRNMSTFTVGKDDSVSDCISLELFKQLLSTVRRDFTCFVKF